MGIFDELLSGSLLDLVDGGGETSGFNTGLIDNATESAFVNPYAASIDVGIMSDQAKINQAQGRAMLPQGMQHAKTYSQAPQSQAMPMGGLMGLAMQQAPQAQPRGQAYSNPYIQSLMGG